MNHPLVSLVTDEPPRVKLGGTDGDLPVIQFGPVRGGHGFDVQLPTSLMSPEAQAAWLLGFAQDLTDLAARIQTQAATVTA